MSKLLIVLLWLLSFSSFSIAQKEVKPVLWRLMLVDSTSLKGISKTTVKIANNLFITDLTGHIDINRSLLHKNDILKITSVGYENKNYLISNVNKLDGLCYHHSLEYVPRLRR